MYRQIMEERLVCVVVQSMDLRLSLTLTLCKRFSKVMSMEELDVAYYRKYLLNLDGLCLIISAGLIHSAFEETVGANGHTMIPVMDNEHLPLPKKHKILILPEDREEDVLRKVEAAGHNLKDSVMPETLSERETEVVRFVALGHTNKEIADMLFISPHTVMTHRKNISTKLGIKTISGLTVYAILKNIIRIDEAEV